jgi:hypothetical protein
MTFRTAVIATVTIAVFILLIALARIAWHGSLALGMHEEGVYQPVCEAVYEAKHLEDAVFETGDLWQASMAESPDPILQDDLLTEFQHAISDALDYYIVASPLDDIHANYVYYRLMEFSTADDGLVGMREGYDVSGPILAASYYKMRGDELYDTLDCKDSNVNLGGQVTD